MDPEFLDQVFDLHLERFAVGGSVGFGLEGRNDPGLSDEKFVHVPSELKFNPKLRVFPIQVGDPCPYGGLWRIDAYPYDTNPVHQGRVYFHRGDFWIFSAVPASSVNVALPSNVALSDLSETDLAELGDSPLAPDEYRCERDFNAWSTANRLATEKARGSRLPEGQAGGRFSAATEDPEGRASHSRLVAFHAVTSRDFSKATVEGPEGQQVPSFYVPFRAKVEQTGAPNCTVRHVASFIAHNIDAYRGNSHALTGVAGRLLCYLMGYLSSTTEAEYDFVDEDRSRDVATEQAEKVAELLCDTAFRANVTALAAARLASWRHTGQTMKPDFVEKFLKKWNRVDTEEPVDRSDKDLLYSTFHAVGNASMMVALYPDRYETTAVFNADAGIPKFVQATKEQHQCINVKGGVAGTKLIVDSLLATKAAIQAGHFICFRSADQGPKLSAVNKIVAANGLLTGTACRRWVRDNVFKMRAAPVDQHDSSIAEICRHASLYAVHFLQGHSLSQAKSLQKCAQQHPDSAYKKLWRALRLKQQLSAISMDR